MGCKRVELRARRDGTWGEKGDHGVRGVEYGMRIGGTWGAKRWNFDLEEMEHGVRRVAME